jgi:hypothetical protein
MHTVKIVITNKDRKVGAMVKALAVEVSGFQAVTGTTKEFLSSNGYYQFNFPDSIKASDFKEFVKKYISANLAQISD